MIPKIGGMADAIYQGVHEAVIIDGRVPHSIPVSYTHLDVYKRQG